MYEIFRNVIENGLFKVNDLTDKINTIWIDGGLSQEERDHLLRSMIDHLNPATEAPELEQKIEKISKQVIDIQISIQSLILRVTALEGGDPEEPQIPGKIPLWEAWDGVSSQYQYGSVVMHSEKYYVDALKNLQNVWESGTSGIDDRYWMEITKEQAEALIDGTINLDDILGREADG